MILNESQSLISFSKIEFQKKNYFELHKMAIQIK